MAQLVERLIRNQQIVSSNLTGGSIKYKGLCRNFLHKPSSFALFQGSNRVAKIEIRNFALLGNWLIYFYFHPSACPGQA